MITVDKSRCMPCGLCFRSYDNVFVQGADGKAEVKAELKDKKDEELTQAEKDSYAAAKGTCPVEAIK